MRQIALRNREFDPQGARIHDCEKTFRWIDLLAAYEIDGHDSSRNRRSNRCTPLLALLNGGRVILGLRTFGSLQLRLRLPDVELGSLQLLQRNRSTLVELTRAIQFLLAQIDFLTSLIYAGLKLNGRGPDLQPLGSRKYLLDFTQQLTFPHFAAGARHLSGIRNKPACKRRKNAGFSAGARLDASGNADARRNVFLGRRRSLNVVCPDLPGSQMNRTVRRNA